jgi:hypothetical protein
MEMAMKAFLKYFAYFCLITTPVQVLLVIWRIWIVITTEYSII